MLVVIARPATAVPTPIPAFALVDRSELSMLDEEADAQVVEEPVAEEEEEH